MASEKVELIYPTIARWHCVDLMLKNLEKAEKPKNIQVLAIVASDDKFANYLEKGLKKIFKKVRVVRNDQKPVEHDELRGRIEGKKLWASDINLRKIQNVKETYELAMKHIDKTADYYWFIEDDTLFPLNTYSRMIKAMDLLEADVVSGISYYWHTDKKDPRNFWQFVKAVDEGIGNKGVKADDKAPSFQTMPPQDGGIAKLGATGLGNVIAKREVVKRWIPTEYPSIKSGADISFFWQCMQNGYSAYGIWDLFLPHITW